MVLKMSKYPIFTTESLIKGLYLKKKKIFFKREKIKKESRKTFLTAFSSSWFWLSLTGMRDSIVYVKQ